MTLAVKHILNDLFNVEADWRLQLFSAWPTIVGSLQTRIRLEKIQDDTVIVGVYESHWMQELFLLSRVLVASINKHLKEPYIKHIRFKLIEDQRLHAKKLITTQEKKELMVTTLAKNEYEALKNIDDIQLRTALQDYYLRCLENKHA